MTIKVSPAFILTLAPLSTSELRPSETNWASVNNYRDLAAPTETARPWLVWRDRAAMGRSDPVVSLKTSASFTRRVLEEVQSISGAGAEVGPRLSAS